MSEQFDMAVDLEVIPAPLPEIQFLQDFVVSVPEAPPQLIEGILHQGCKMVLGGTSKSNKSWCLLNLALSVASGTEWWGRRCVKAPVVYINFELHGWAIAQRIMRWRGPGLIARGLQIRLRFGICEGGRGSVVASAKLEEHLTRHQRGGIGWRGRERVLIWGFRSMN